MVPLAIQGITSFSTTPIRLITVMGFYYLCYLYLAKYKGADNLYRRQNRSRLGFYYVAAVFFGRYSDVVNWNNRRICR